MLSLIKSLRFFFAAIVPLIVVTMALLEMYRPDWLWASMVFAIALASCVGFYTNFIAIKMLFKPRYPTAFGRQGLIPRKQPELAQRLGEGINEHFFNAAEIRRYLDQNQLLERGSEQLKVTLDEKLQEPKLQQQLSVWLAQVLEDHTDEIHQFMVNVADHNLPKLIAQNTDLVDLAQQFSDYIEKQIEDGSIDLEQVVDKFTEIAAEHIPELARWLHEQFEDYNANQGVIKRNFVSFLKWSSDIDEESLKDQLFYLISTLEFRQAVYGFAERMALSGKDYLQTDKGLEQLNNISQQLNQYLVRRAREEGIPFAIQWLQDWLKTPTAWATIETFLVRTVDFATREMDRYVHSERFNNDVEQGLKKLLTHFNIQQLVTQKVAQLDTDKLEDLVLSASREHLVAIEVLGGILGAFAGVALFSIPTFLTLVGIAITIWLAEWLAGYLKH